jgi:hypothetical protein
LVLAYLNGHVQFNAIVLADGTTGQGHHVTDRAGQHVNHGDHGKALVSVSEAIL